MIKQARPYVARGITFALYRWQVVQRVSTIYLRTCIPALPSVYLIVHLSTCLHTKYLNTQRKGKERTRGRMEMEMEMR